MKFFRSVTSGHAVIMGRKTYDSIGSPLSGRLNIVVSRDPGNESANIRWVNNIESALFFADYHSILMEKPQFMIIGGDQIYSMFDGFVNKIFLTEVFHKFPDGDAFFKKQFDRRKWKTIEESDYPASEYDEFPFRISVLERRLKKVRQRDIREFLVSDVAQDGWEKDKLFRKAELFDHLDDEQFPLPGSEGWSDTSEAQLTLDLFGDLSVV